jgi:hypothetical protein
MILFGGDRHCALKHFIEKYYCTSQNLQNVIVKNMIPHLCSLYIKFSTVD